MTAPFADEVADLRRENVRLQTELRAAREQQAGSAEVLRAIASSSGDAERSLQQIAETAARLFGARSVTIRIAEGENWGQTIRVGASSKRIGMEVPAAQLGIAGRNLPGRVVRENRQIHAPDLDNLDPDMADRPGLLSARAAGTRTVAGTPLRREGKAFGVFVVYRDQLAPFTIEELALQQSFADQAVIAIENARLFNETQQALARQTATSDILRVISQSPTDTQPVFEAIVLTATRLLRCDRSAILRCDDRDFWSTASAGPEGPLPIVAMGKMPIDPDSNFPSRAITEKKTLHFPDWSLIELPEHERHFREMSGTNSALFLPLLREGECIGLLVMLGKQAGIFGESEIALAESFRDQALVAIENTRLFNETREALERQTATADILKVIASSPVDVQPVFEAIATSANRLIGGFSTAVQRVIDDVVHLAAFTPTNSESDEALKAAFPRHRSEVPAVALVQNGETAQIADAETADAHTQRAWPCTRLAQRHLHAVDEPGRVASVLSPARGARPGVLADHHVQLLADFRRPGGDRDRERAAVQRDQGSAGAADRDGRDPEGDRQFAVRRAAGIRGHC